MNALLLSFVVAASAGGFKKATPGVQAPTTVHAAGIPVLPQAQSAQPGKAATAQAAATAEMIQTAALAPIQSAENKLEVQSAQEQLGLVEKVWDDKRDSDFAVLAMRRVTPRMGRVIASSFDWDDNLTGPGFPTRIVLYKGGTQEKLPVSTADWAKIRKHVGQDFAYNGVNLKDYALGADSFARFQDGPNGENYFLQDLKYAVEHLRPEEWQGPSWRAFVEALSDRETARWAAIITAREMSPRSLMEGLRYLQSVGQIKHLPSFDHLYMVGGASNPSKLKAKGEEKILDRIARLPFGRNAARLVDQDGRGRAQLHTAGFSDDDWGNIEAMRKRLASSLRKNPARWKNIKIVLYFTGANEPDHAPGAYVLTSQGRTRTLTRPERGEWLKRGLHESGLERPRAQTAALVSTPPTPSAPTMPSKLERLRPWAPHAVTALNLVSGLAAIVAASHGMLFVAAGLILAANVFDAFDGRVARALGVESPLGVQLDSLADVVSFGIAPAILLYEGFLGGLGVAGFLAAAAFALGGAYRLGRFNVGAAQPVDPAHPKPDSFTGLPIPGGAGVAVAFTLAASSLPAVLVAPLAVVVSLLSAAAMVSRLPYPAFKKGGRPLALFVAAVLAASLPLALSGAWAMIPAAVFGVYLLSGPLAALRG